MATLMKNLIHPHLSTKNSNPTLEARIDRTQAAQVLLDEIQSFKFDSLRQRAEWALKEIIHPDEFKPSRRNDKLHQEVGAYLEALLFLINSPEGKLFYD